MESEYDRILKENRDNWINSGGREDVEFDNPYYSSFDEMKPSIGFFAAGFFIVGMIIGYWLW